MKDRLINLAKKYDTPLYVYDGDKIIEKYKTFKKSFKVKNLKIHFAVKALRFFMNYFSIEISLKMESAFYSETKHTMSNFLRI